MAFVFLLIEALFTNTRVTMNFAIFTNIIKLVLNRLPTYFRFACTGFKMVWKFNINFRVKLILFNCILDLLWQLFVDSIALSKKSKP